MSARILEISKLGDQGDGIAEHDGRQVFIPYTAPGDRVSAAVEKSRGTLISVLSAGPDRVEPPCPHFGPDRETAGCGGCALEHISMSAYSEWKRGLVTAALQGVGIKTPVGPLVGTEPGTRRRVVFAAKRSERGVVLGFNRAASHEIVAVETCLVASARINQAMDSLRTLASVVALGPQAFRFSVLDTASGFDISVEAPFRISDTERHRIVNAVRKTAGVARLSFNEEVLIERNPPQIRFGAVTVNPPPGSFTQASEAAENVMGDLVSAHMTKAKRVADLFSGCGTFTFRLAGNSAVHAVEANAAALAALDRAARHHQGLKAVTVERRDLNRRPLMVQELKNFQGLVFDPPRAGAEIQVREIARSAVTWIAAVSCNPVTLARDLAILTASGYRINSITPIDQFLWTPHVEVVVLLQRGK